MSVQNALFAWPLDTVPSPVPQLDKTRRTCPFMLDIFTTQQQHRVSCTEMCILN
jgi:hypothetical protein